MRSKSYYQQLKKQINLIVINLKVFIYNLKKNLFKNLLYNKIMLTVKKGIPIFYRQFLMCFSKNVCYCFN